MGNMVRQAAVAGSFYPKDQRALKTMIHRFLDQVQSPRSSQPPLALVAPHAGYVYSGLTAAYAYHHLKPAREPQRVFILAPSHRVYQDGVSVGHYAAYATPLGEVPIDQETTARLAQLPDVTRENASHEQEHAVEVHLPFLQETLMHFRLVPMVYGDISGGHLADILSRVWQPRDLLIISTDLSHYFDYDKAKLLDEKSCAAIAAGNPKGVEQCEACGSKGIAALLELSRRHRWRSELLDYRNSGDTAGSKDRVVGYASYLFYPQFSESSTTMTNSKQSPATPAWEQLPQLARSYLEGLLAGQPGTIDKNKWLQTCPELAQTGACFVTLTKKGRLRGCIGSLEAHRSLLDDLLDNAEGAAIRDPRFRPLLRQELDETNLEISILTPAVPLHYVSSEDLLNKLKVGEHGVILSQAGRRATFLPQVWEQLPDKITFLTHLCQKAGLHGDCWRHQPAIQVYTVAKIKEVSG
ncbi:MAG: AmmeMemoRadiSam system protein B [Magnetococcales bacterium]|nr:AmmeMemoRadiSam system protein B [Magnetococcales bacterium]